MSGYGLLLSCCFCFPTTLGRSVLPVLHFIANSVKVALVLIANLLSLTFSTTRM